MVGEFVCCSFCSDATTLIEGFVEDADSFEGLAVCAGGCAGALDLLVWFVIDIDVYIVVVGIGGI